MSGRFIACLLLFVFAQSNAQPGGNFAFSFLSIPVSAREGSMGGGLVTAFDNDPSLIITDPSQLDKSMHHQAVFNFLDYFAGISSGYAGYSRNIGNHPYFAGIQYLNYGKFAAADEYGNITGEFSAADYAIIAGTSRRLSDTNFRVGLNLKFLYSHLETYNSIGIAGDLAFGYHHPKLGLGASIVASDFGYQITTYQGGKRYGLPTNLRLGLSKTLEKAPLRFSLTYNHLQKFNITYFDSTQLSSVNTLTGEPEREKEPGVVDRAARHLVVGAEIYPLKVLILRLGYNYQRRAEMMISERPATVGISWGLGLKLKKFHFSYSRAAYHLAGPSNHFTLQLNLLALKSS